PRWQPEIAHVCSPGAPVRAGSGPLAYALTRAPRIPKAANSTQKTNKIEILTTLFRIDVYTSLSLNEFNCKVNYPPPQGSQTGLQSGYSREGKFSQGIDLKCATKVNARI